MAQNSDLQKLFEAKPVKTTAFILAMIIGCIGAAAAAFSILFMFFGIMKEGWRAIPGAPISQISKSEIHYVVTECLDEEYSTLLSCFVKCETLSPYGRLGDKEERYCKSYVIEQLRARG